MWGPSRDYSQGSGEEAQHGGSGGTQPADEPRRGSARGTQTACKLGRFLVAKLWTSVRVVALDEGWAKPGSDVEPESKRKLRPIACAAPLLKFAETLVIEEEIKDVLKKLEPRQLGCGTPDAAPLRLMRSWVEDIQASTLQSRNATSSERCNTPQEQETAEMDDVEDAQQVEIDIDGKDGRRHDGCG